MTMAIQQSTAGKAGYENAASTALHDSLVILCHFMGGQGTFSLALEALRHLEYVCGHPVRGAIQKLRRAMFYENEDLRIETMRQSLGEIWQWLNRE